MYKIVLGILFIATFLACTQEPSKTNEKVFFDLGGLIDQQIVQFKKDKPGLRKMMSVNGRVDESVVYTIDWEKELEIAKQADLNKSAYANSYVVAQENIETIYTLNPTENLPVKWQKITKNYDGSVLVEVQISNDNFLFKSDKKLNILFDNDKLISYQIAGTQQLFLGDKNAYRIEAEILN